MTTPIKTQGAHTVSGNPWDRPLASRLHDLKAETIRVGYFYEVPDTGTFRYRAYNMAQALNSFSSTHSAAYFFLSDIPLVEKFTDFVDVLVLVRFRHSGVVGRLIDQFRAVGKPVVFDIDDLIFHSDHTAMVAATLNFGLEPGLILDNWYALATRLGHTLSLCDTAITTTPTLAAEIENRHQIPVTIIPNFLNQEQQEISQELRSSQPANPQSGLRIGYFSGSRSHARDFDIAVPGIAKFLARHKQARLIIAGILDFPEELVPVQDQIERLPFMDYLSLQRAIHQVDVNIVPLQLNAFTDSKSELKFFEAAAVDTITIASPTEVFRRVISEGKTGFLSSADRWEQSLTHVQSLSSKERTSMEKRAREVALATYTVETQRKLLEKTFSRVKA